MNQKNSELKSEAPVLHPVKRVKTGIIISFFGYFVLLLGAKPSLFGLDRSPVIGFIQTATFLIGLVIISLGGYLSLMSFWPKGFTTLTADIGVRLVFTGVTIAIFSGMADVFGIGSHPITGVPFFGNLQSAGVEIGEMIIAVGFGMMILPDHSTLRYKKEDTIKKIDMTEE